VGGRDQFFEGIVKLWIENAHRSLSAPGEECGDVARTFQAEDHFFAILVSSTRACAEGKAKAARMAEDAAAALEQAHPLEEAVEGMLNALLDGEHVPFSILQALDGSQAHLVECDAPPLFLTRAGQLELLPVVEGESHGRLLRECWFTLHDGDHLAMVSEGYIQAKRWSRRWGWRDVATSIRRWTDTRCDAEQLLDALIGTYRKLAEGNPERDVSVVAMAVRPLRSATVWSGPPSDPALDEMVFGKLMTEPDLRIICGDTTAEVAARLLGVELEPEPRPPDGWAEVPPTWRLNGVSLVTEGVVTLSRARERLATAQRVRDLPRQEDGATHLARLLLTADRIHFLVGRAVNPAQTADEAGTVPLRLGAIENLIQALQARKIVSVEHF
jgi:hypothetical protein